MSIIFSPQPTSTKSISVSNTSATVALATTGNVLSLVNTGSKTCYVRYGNGSQTAVTTDYPILSGERLFVSRAPGSDGATYAAAICGGSDTTTLLITSGEAI